METINLEFHQTGSRFSDVGAYYNINTTLPPETNIPCIILNINLRYHVSFLPSPLPCSVVCQLQVKESQRSDETSIKRKKLGIYSDWLVLFLGSMISIQLAWDAVWRVILGIPPKVQGSNEQYTNWLNWISAWSFNWWSGTIISLRNWKLRYCLQLPMILSC